MHKISTNDQNIIAGKIIKSWEDYKGSKKTEFQPHNFCLQNTTVWSFKERGDWASHTPQYRGNWSPYVVRNILEHYSSKGDTVLDPMVGGGTTPVECLLTGRNSICYDINPCSVNIVKDRMNLPQMEHIPKTVHSISVGDTRDLKEIENNSIDLIATHPPYANIIQYSEFIEEDFSRMEISVFFEEFRKAIKEYYRVLKNNKYCAILIGDTHKRGHYIPIANKMLLCFLEAGFILKEDIIKIEWNCQSSVSYMCSNNNFLLTSHEHLYVFKKIDQKDMQRYYNSSMGFLKE